MTTNCLFHRRPPFSICNNFSSISITFIYRNDKKRTNQRAYRFASLTNQRELSIDGIKHGRKNRPEVSLFLKRNTMVCNLRFEKIPLKPCPDVLSFKISTSPACGVRI